MSGTPIVYGVSPSPFVRKVRIVLAMKGVEYTLEPVMPGMVPPDFEALNPLRKVPVYCEPASAPAEADFVLPDSSAICAYLEKAHPEPRLYPEDPKQHGRAVWIEEYADTQLMDVIAPIFFERVLQTRIYRMKSDEKKVERQLQQRVPPTFDVLESWLVGESGYFVGEKVSIADIAVLSPLLNFHHAGEAVDAGRWPQLAHWMQHALAYETIASIFEEEKATFPPA